MPGVYCLGSTPACGQEWGQLTTCIYWVTRIFHQWICFFPDGTSIFQVTMPGFIRLKLGQSGSVIRDIIFICGLAPQIADLILPNTEYLFILVRQCYIWSGNPKLYIMASCSIVLGVLYINAWHQNLGQKQNVTLGKHKIQWKIYIFVQST